MSEERLYPDRFDPPTDFAKQKDELDEIIAFTLNPAAWKRLKAQLKDVVNPVQVKIMGIPVYILNKQVDDCIGWRNQEMLELWLKANDSEHIVELPHPKSEESKGSA